MKRRSSSRVWRLADLALAIAILSALALVAARGFLGEPETLTGVPRVVDGDSISLGETRIRLAGIDAPETDQTCTNSSGNNYACGVMARDALHRMIGGRVVSCKGTERDRYDRFLGYCEAGGVDLNRAMVEQGWAIAYGDYSGAEREARSNARGIWAGHFERPQEWRRMHGGLLEDNHGSVFARMFGFPVWRLFE